MNAMKHVRYLSETIGPRGSTTPQEAKAARYAVRVFHESGMEPVMESFSSARSGWYPFALFSGLVLLGEILLSFAAFVILMVIIKGCDLATSYKIRFFQ